MAEDLKAEARRRTMEKIEASLDSRHPRRPTQMRWHKVPETRSLHDRDFEELRARIEKSNREAEALQREIGERRNGRLC